MPAAARLALASASALEGQGGYVIGTEGLFRTDTLDVKSSVLTGTVTAPSLVFAPSPALVSGAVAGTLSVSIAASNTSLDSGFITVSAGGRIVDTADISKLLQTGGGTATIAGIPAGSVLAPNAWSGLPGGGARVEFQRSGRHHHPSRGAQQRQPGRFRCSQFDDTSVVAKIRSVLRLGARTRPGIRLRSTGISR